MISNQESLNPSPYMAIYDIVVPKDNFKRRQANFYFACFSVASIERGYLSGLTAKNINLWSSAAH